MVSGKVRIHGSLSRGVKGRIFGGHDDLLTVASSDHPFAEPFFGLSSLVRIGSVGSVSAISGSSVKIAVLRVDEVPSLLEKIVEDLKCGLLVAFWYSMSDSGLTFDHLTCKPSPPIACFLEVVS